MLADLVVDPAAFFADRDFRLGGPLVIVTSTVGLGVTKSLLRALAAAPTGLSSSPVASFRFWSVVTPLLWLSFVAAYYLVTFHLLAAALDGAGPPSDTLAVVGWGFAPKLFAVVAMMGLALPLVVLGDPGSVAGFSGGLLANGFRGVLVLAALATSAYIWYHGLAAAHGLDRRMAAIAVGPPVVLAALFDVLFVLLVMVGVL